jgi:hypothetical protein
MIGRGRVKVIDAGIYRVPDLPDGAFLINFTGFFREPHAAIAEDGETVAGFWNGTVEHEYTCFGN